MKQRIAASAAPLLRDALDKVLHGSSIIAEVSASDFETYSELLHPAKRGIYSVLSNIYAEHPDLDPLAAVPSATDLTPTEAALTPPGEETRRNEGVLNADTARRAQAIFREANDLLARAQGVLASGGELEDDMDARFRELCVEAAESIQLTLRRLPGGSGS